MRTHTKVLHCAETIKGGIASYLNILLDEQTKDFKAYKFSLIVPKSHMKELNVNLNNEYNSFNDTKSRIVNSFKLTNSVLKKMREFKPDIVHIHSFFAGIFLRPLLFLFTNVKVVYCPHGWSFDRETNKFSSYISIVVEYLLSFFTHKIICISNHEKSLAGFIKNSEKKLALIKNAVNIKKYINHNIEMVTDWPEKKVKLLFVGRYDRQKGLDTLLEAIKDLIDDVYLVIVGENVLDDENQINEKIRNMHNVKEIGWVDTNKLKNYYYNADVIIIPSRWEGFGLVAVEAMICGLPVIASNVGGLSEIVIENKTGKFFNSNCSHQLKTEIQALTKEKIQKWSNNSVSIAKELYNVNRLKKEINNLYEEILF